MLLLFHIFWIKQTMLKEVFWLELVQRPSSCRKIRTVCRPKGTCLKTWRFLYIPINFKVKRAESMSAFPLGFEHSPAAAPGHAASASNSGKGNVRCGWELEASLGVWGRNTTWGTLGLAAPIPVGAPMATSAEASIMQMGIFPTRCIAGGAQCRECLPGCR